MDHIILFIMVYKCCILNCCSNNIGEERTMARKRPNEKMDNIRQSKIFAAQFLIIYVYQTF